MKTVNGLRKAILSNEGKLNIGKLSFKYTEGSDIDIHIDGNLLAWIGSHAKNETQLSDVTMTISSGALADRGLKDRAGLADVLEEKVSNLENKLNDKESLLELNENKLEDLRQRHSEDLVTLRVYQGLMNREITLGVPSEE